MTTTLPLDLRGKVIFTNVGVPGLRADTTVAPPLPGLKGTILLIPDVVGGVSVPGHDEKFYPARALCDATANGKLSFDGVEGVSILSDQIPGATPPGWTWTAHPNLTDADGNYVHIDPFSFHVPAGGTVDLADYLPVDSSPGVQIIKGADGAPGGPGAPGPAPTLLVGTTTILPAGSSPTVTVRGSNPYILDFGIPEGATGGPGPIGPSGINFRNMWDAAIDYVNSDVVYYEGSSWFAFGDPPVGEVPSQDSVYWYPMAMHGKDSTVPGPPGAPGPPGPAPTMQAGTATTLPSGAAPTISISGADPYKVDIGIPAGAPGPANTLTIGSVTTGAAGTAAAASITGAVPNQKLNLTIPQGPAGATATGSTVYDSGTKHKALANGGYINMRRIGAIVYVTVKAEVATDGRTPFNLHAAMPGGAYGESTCMPRTFTTNFPVVIDSVNPNTSVSWSLTPPAPGRSFPANLRWQWDGSPGYYDRALYYFKISVIADSSIDVPVTGWINASFSYEAAATMTGISQFEAFPAGWA